MDRLDKNARPSLPRRNFWGRENTQAGTRAAAAFHRFEQAAGRNVSILQEVQCHALGFWVHAGDGQLALLSVRRRVPSGWNTHSGTSRPLLVHYTADRSNRRCAKVPAMRLAEQRTASRRHEPRCCISEHTRSWKISIITVSCSRRFRRFSVIRI